MFITSSNDIRQFKLGFIAGELYFNDKPYTQCKAKTERGRNAWSEGFEHAKNCCKIGHDIPTGNHKSPFGN